MPENQAKREGSEVQNHPNFGSIKYPQTYLLLVLEQNNHKSTLKDMNQSLSNIFNKVPTYSSKDLLSNHYHAKPK